MTSMRTIALVLLFAASAASAEPARVQVSGRVVDAVTHAGIPDAIVTVCSTAIRTDASGQFTVDASRDATIRARAAGYLRADVTVQSLADAHADIPLKPFRPKALYLSMYGISHGALRSSALNLIDGTELNALVIDVKGDRALVAYPSKVALAAQVGAQKIITMRDLPGLLKDLHGRGIYTIARIVVFKDNLLATGRPDLAIRRQNGSIYTDRERLAWTNPFSHEVWNYNIAIATEVAAAGFDEIQFDYVRLPDTRGLVYEVPWTEANRAAAINGFLKAAHDALVPYNVFLAADVFGYICWNSDDTGIGQKIEHVSEVVDYISPMLYPSGFQFGIPGYKNPVEHPSEIVRKSLERARDRTRLAPVHFRPWLQAFRDYAFGGRPFTNGEVRTQIDAAEAFGSDGWMIWNPRNNYSAADFKR